MNLIKYVFSLFTFVSVSYAQAPIVYTPSPESNMPIEHNALVATNSPLPASISSQIRAYKGWDADLMTAIFTCESGLKQFKADGSPVQSHTNDWGIAQINELVWDETAKQLGLDYKNSVEDNIKMAIVVHRLQGNSAWVCYNRMYDTTK